MLYTGHNLAHYIFFFLSYHYTVALYRVFVFSASTPVKSIYIACITSMGYSQYLTCSADCSPVRATFWLASSNSSC